MTKQADARDPDPHLDPSRWHELIEGAGVDSILLVIGSWMGERLRGHCSVEDVWQETLLLAWRDRPRFVWQGHKSFRCWLLAIARNRILDLTDYVKARRRGGDVKTVFLSSLPADLDGSISAWLPAVTKTPERLAYYRERARLMEEALRSLDQATAGIVRAYLFADETMPVIANRLSLPLSTAWSRFRSGSIAYARKLEQLLDSSGLQPPRPPAPA